MFFGALIFSLAGMAVIPLRHLSYIRGREQEDQQSESVVRAYVVGLISRFEEWYRSSAREWFLKFLDRVLKIFERAAGRIAGQTKALRFMIQEHFRVIPRESLYWKQIRTWKQSNGNGSVDVYTATISRGEDTDISNHAL